jgi:membrane protein DedA with SNARE-associated domain
MTEAMLGLVPAYGPLAVFVATVLSCFGIPVPGSLVLLAAGSFVASGEIALAAVLFAGLAGAIVGDQAGYWLGALGGERVALRLSRRHRFATALGAAKTFALHWGRLSVFFSRWLVVPLGPPTNLVAGLLGMSWLAFSLIGGLGELVWVCGYVALGYAFSQSIVAISALLVDLAWFLAAGAIAIDLAIRVRAAAHRAFDPRPHAPTVSAI